MPRCGADIHICKGTFSAAFPHLDAVLHFQMSEEFAIDGEEREVSLIIINDAVTFAGRLDESGPLAELGALQGPKQVPIHGMDQTRTLCKEMNQFH